VARARSSVLTLTKPTMPSSTLRQARCKRGGWPRAFRRIRGSNRALRPSVARVAKVAAALVALGVGGPAAIDADDAQKRQSVPDHGVELVLAKGVNTRAGR
jgi:hypothetical protein